MITLWQTITVHHLIIPNHSSDNIKRSIVTRNYPSGEEIDGDMMI
jgi:hypothetical protein